MDKKAHRIDAMYTGSELYWFYSDGSMKGGPVSPENMAEAQSKGLQCYRFYCKQHE